MATDSQIKTVTLHLFPLQKYDFFVHDTKKIS